MRNTTSHGIERIATDPIRRLSTVRAERSADFRCQECGARLTGITTTGPGEHHASPCGCKLPPSALLSGIAIVDEVRDTEDAP